MGVCDYMRFKNNVKRQIADNLGQVISEARREQNVSQGDLAEKANISVTFLSLLENGKRFPSMRTFKKIALCLGIESTKLLLKAALDDTDEDFKMLRILNDAIETRDEAKMKQIIDSINSIDLNLN
jgi:transcriptional regulator with XRE-family HTH domain